MTAIGWLFLCIAIGVIIEVIHGKDPLTEFINMFSGVTKVADITTKPAK